jgi:gas vesicle protein
MSNTHCKKGERIMHKDSSSMIKGAAMGLAAGAAAGIAGAYLAGENKRQMKKFVKKAEKTAEHALGKLDSYMSAGR